MVYLGGPFVHSPDQCGGWLLHSRGIAAIVRCCQKTAAIFDSQHVSAQGFKLSVTSSIAVWIRVVYPNLPYVVSKVALTQMVETLSTTLTPHGIRIDSSALSVYTAEHISNVYGDYEQITSYGSILKELTPLAKTGGVEDLV